MIKFVIDLRQVGGFSLGPPVSSTNKTDRHDITEILFKMLYWVHLSWAGFELATLIVIGTDCIGSCKSNYHAITATTAPGLKWEINMDVIA
jgi:hypothetical protein